MHDSYGLLFFQSNKEAGSELHKHLGSRLLPISNIHNTLCSDVLAQARTSHIFYSKCINDVLFKSWVSSLRSLTVWWQRLASTGSNSSRVLCWSSMSLSRSASETRRPLRPLRSWEWGTWRSQLQNICKIKRELSFIWIHCLLLTVTHL